MRPRQFGRIRFFDGDEYGFEIVDDEPRVDTVMDVNVLFLQHVEDGLGVAVEPALEVVDGLTCTFQLMSFHVLQAFEMKIASAALVFLGVRR